MFQHLPSSPSELTEARKSLPEVAALDQVSDGSPHAPNITRGQFREYTVNSLLSLQHGGTHCSGVHLLLKFVGFRLAKHST